MKILFTITGIGLGHATRDLAIIKKLNARVKIGTYLDAYKFFKNKYGVFKIPRIRFPASFSVSMWKILLSNIFTPIELFRAYLKLKKEIIRFKPDLVITDSELVTAYIAKKVDVPFIAIHNYDMKEIIKKKPDKNLGLQAKYLYKLVDWGEKNCKKVIVPELLGRVRKNKNVHYINPIVNESKKIIKNDAVLVMLGGSVFGHSFIKKLIPYLKKQDEKFIIFGYKDFKEKNIISYKFNPDFVSYLRGCKGLITLAGYTSLSEALFYKVPSLVFPIPGHIEQYVNAQNVSKVFQVDFHNKKESISKFLKSVDEQRKKLKKLKVKNGLGDAVRLIKKVVKS